MPQDAQVAAMVAAVVRHFAVNGCKPFSLVGARDLVWDVEPVSPGWPVPKLFRLTSGEEAIVVKVSDVGVAND